VRREHRHRHERNDRMHEDELRRRVLLDSVVSRRPSWRSLGW
jgi:hypothetical protein